MQSTKLVLQGEVLATLLAGDHRMRLDDLAELAQSAIAQVALVSNRYRVEDSG